MKSSCFSPSSVEACCNTCITFWGSAMSEGWPIMTTLLRFADNISARLKRIGLSNELTNNETVMNCTIKTCKWWFPGGVPNQSCREFRKTKAVGCLAHASRTWGSNSKALDQLAQRLGPDTQDGGIKVVPAKYWYKSTPCKKYVKVSQGHKLS